MSPRPRQPAGTFGKINVAKLDNGSWRARTRYRFQDGVLRQVERVAETKAQAELALKTALAAIETPSSADITKDMRLGQLVDVYLQHKADTDRAPRTLDTYRHNAEKIIKPGIGQLTVGEATTGRLQAFITRVQKQHGHGSAKGVRSVLSGMMSLAVRADAITINPVANVAGIEKPKGQRGSYAIPAEELPTFIATIHDDSEMQRLDLADLFEFMAYVGCRIGAALALSWDDVDLKKGSVTFRGTVVSIRGQGLQVQPFQKTEASARTIYPPKAAIALLRRRSTEPRPNLYNVVFPSLLGHLRDPSNTQADWRNNRDRLGYPNFSTQGFRKTVTDILDSSGISARDIADYLGHGDVAITQNVYMSRGKQSPAPGKALDSFLNESAELSRS